MNITFTDIARRWRLIIASVMIFALIAFIISALLPAKYQSDISMIVVQKQSSEKVDAFSATKSAEFLSNIFAQVIYTTSFFNAVQNAPFDAKRDFSLDPEERKREWKDLIDVKKVNNTGILNISVYEKSRTTTEETAKAIAYILTTNSEEYHGGGERVDVRLINGPNTPLRPTVPRIGQNTAIGAFIGLVLAIVFIYFFPDKLLLSKNEIIYDEPFTVVTYDNVEEKEDVDHQKIVQDHFQNAETMKVYDDPEVNELHERINAFNQNQSAK
jgi:capsular polysaccharide biosynthesis protein